MGFLIIFVLISVWYYHLKFVFGDDGFINKANK